MLRRGAALRFLAPASRAVSASGPALAARGSRRAAPAAALFASSRQLASTPSPGPARATLRPRGSRPPRPPCRSRPHGCRRARGRRRGRCRGGRSLEPRADPAWSAVSAGHRRHQGRRRDPRHGLACVGLVARAPGRGAGSRRLRDAGLVVLGVLGAACWWNLFQFHFPGFGHPSDTFHYYLGAKYFPELRYTRLYACTAVADAESGVPVERALRDLETNTLTSSAAALADPDACRRTLLPGALGLLPRRCRLPARAHRRPPLAALPAGSRLQRHAGLGGAGGRAHQHGSCLGDTARLAPSARPVAVGGDGGGRGLGLRLAGALRGGDLLRHELRGALRLDRGRDPAPGLAVRDGDGPVPAAAVVVRKRRGAARPGGPAARLSGPGPGRDRAGGRREDGARAAPLADAIRAADGLRCARLRAGAAAALRRVRRRPARLARVRPERPGAPRDAAREPRGAANRALPRPGDARGRCPRRLARGSDGAVEARAPRALRPVRGAVLDAGRGLRAADRTGDAARPRLGGRRARRGVDSRGLRAHRLLRVGAAGAGAARRAKAAHGPGPVRVRGSGLGGGKPLALDRRDPRVAERIGRLLLRVHGPARDAARPTAATPEATGANAPREGRSLRRE
jgi:hypothetical protein